MEHIGKTSGHKSKQKESDPEKERMRLELIAAFRKEKIGRKIRQHIEEITDEDALGESVSYLFDTEGRPPANAPLESIIKQQRNLSAQIKWLDAWSLVFERKLRDLDEERYWKEESERQRVVESDKTVRREEKGSNEVDRQDGEKGRLLKSLEEAVKSDYRAIRLKKYLGDDDMDACVFGIRRIESGIRLVFSGYVDDRRASDMSPDEQYELIRRQLTWIGVIAAEIRSKLTKVIEISEAALSLMGVEGRPEGGD
jgi:hypothetical protein